MKSFLLFFTLGVILALAYGNEDEKAGNETVNGLESDHAKKVHAAWVEYKQTLDYKTARGAGGWSCHVGYMGVPLHYKEHLMKCRESIPVLKGPDGKDQQNTCLKVCIWKGLGLINAEGKADEDKLHKFSHELNSVKEIANKGVDIFLSCFNENKPDLKDIKTEDHCLSAQPFHKCLKERLHTMCPPKPTNAPVVEATTHKIEG